MSKKGVPTRPLAVTEDRIERIRMALVAGCHYNVAAQHGGVGETVFYQYMRDAREMRADGKAARTKYERLAMKLLETVEQAETEAEVRMVANLSNAARTDWRAAAHLLARRFPERWAEQTSQRIELVGDPTQPLEVRTTTLREVLESSLGSPAAS